MGVGKPDEHKQHVRGVAVLMVERHAQVNVGHAAKVRLPLLSCMLLTCPVHVFMEA